MDVSEAHSIMLVLSRKVGEQILIGDNIVVTVVRIGPKAVRIGIEASNDVPIVRTHRAAMAPSDPEFESPSPSGKG